MKFEEVLVLHQNGDLHGAQKGYKELLKNNPRDFNSIHLLGLTYHQLGEHQKAIELILQALLVNSEYAPAYFNLAYIYQINNQWIKALENYEKAIKIDPAYKDAYFKSAEVLIKLNRFSDALLIFDKLISLDPDNHLVFYQRTEILIKLKKLNEAMADYRKAIELKPDFLEAHFSLANALFELKRFEEALTHYQKAVDINPEYEYLYGMYVQSKTKICNWTGLTQNLNFLESSIKAGKNVTFPFIPLGVFDKPDLHQLCVKTYVESKFLNRKLSQPFTQKRTNNKIRIAYYSSDFRSHPMAQLMISILKLHDRNKFEIYGLSLWPNEPDAVTKVISPVFDEFIDVSSLNDDQIVSLSRKLEIDIAVDLNGHTQHARTEIFSLRCAPVQAQYLGYPGTLAINNIDYVIADRMIIHDKSRSFFTEKVISLPGSYITTNTHQVIADQSRFFRHEFNLPGEGIVFCCFNNCSKIMPATFDSWMRILKSVKGSVLWLLDDNPGATLNLRSEAENRGIDSRRLIFAKRMKLDAHLARHCLADLFLDTLPYNAHTTAMDALWSGLPVLTLIGRSFASRVAASLLKTVGLKELICITQAEYESRAIELGLNPEKLASLKKKLATEKNKTSLFDGAQITRAIETAYSTIYRRHLDGHGPEDLLIDG